jgi:hypothetical protein
VWRARATSGPYRSEGDVSPNSPGDWERIAGHAEAFRDDPSRNRWRGPSGDTCVGDDGDPPRGEAELLRDAAFFSLVRDDPELRSLAASELLERARLPDLDFSDSTRWCPGVYDSSPSFGIAAMLTRLLLTYDYLGMDSFSADEQAELQGWFHAAARWLRTDVEEKLDENFRAREEGDYRLSQQRSADPGWGKVGFLGSQRTGSVARYYNNRRSTAMFFVALVGWQQDDDDMIASSRRYVEEWLAFGVYPNGWTGEFERWREDLPDLGWAYSTYNVALASMIADLFARHGDTTIYEFETSDGVHGTEGGPKGLHRVLRDHAAYLDGTIERYGTDRDEFGGNHDYLIDGVHEPAGWYSVHDIAAVMANRYYADPYLRGVYMRTAEGTSGYPTEVATQGGADAWTGVWGIYPGVLFMHAQMEDVPLAPRS